MNKTDISNIEDIRTLVNDFYDKVRKNDLIGPLFNDRIGDRWPQHLEKMYKFWQTVLLEEHTYFGSPFPPHVKLAVAKDHFDTWLGLWRVTIDEHFEGKLADEAKWRGDKMAALFLSKIQYYQSNSNTPLI